MARFFQPGQTQYTEQFVPMDLGFIQGQMEGRQAKAEKAMAMAKQPGIDMANINALREVGAPGYEDILVGDMQRKNEIMTEFDREISELSEFAISTDPASQEVQRRVEDINRRYNNNPELMQIANRHNAYQELQKKIGESGVTEENYHVFLPQYEALLKSADPSTTIKNMPIPKPVDELKAIDDMVEKMAEQGWATAGQSDDGTLIVSNSSHGVSSQRIRDVIENRYELSDLGKDLELRRKYDTMKYGEEAANQMYNERKERQIEAAIAKFESRKQTARASETAKGKGQGRGIVKKEEKTVEFREAKDTYVPITGRDGKLINKKLPDGTKIANFGQGYIDTKQTDVEGLDNLKDQGLIGDGDFIGTSTIAAIPETKDGKNITKYRAYFEVFEVKRNKAGDVEYDISGNPIIVPGAKRYISLPLTAANAEYIQAATGKLFPEGFIDRLEAGELVKGDTDESKEGPNTSKF
jgi:hypothetical protein